MVGCFYGYIVKWFFVLWFVMGVNAKSPDNFLPGLFIGVYIILKHSLCPGGSVKEEVIKVYVMNILCVHRVQM